MKIAINCIFCQPRGGGIKEYIVNLTNNLSAIDNKNTYILYVLEDQVDFAKLLLPAKYRIKTVPFKSDFLSVIKRSLFSQRFWYGEEVAERFDIFHSPFFYAPKFKKAKLVITVHDLRLYRFPETYGKLRYLFLQHSVKETIRRADKIISISQFTRNEIIDTCQVSPEKIVVIHEAVDRKSFSAEKIENFQLSTEYECLATDRFLFSLGHIEPRKNYKRLIEAFAMIKKDPAYSDLKLVVAGKPNVDADAVIKLIEATPDVKYLNFVPREFLLWLYKNATLFVFPSFYEGFGFPPLEAASMGTVSAVSNVSSIPEICGDCAFYYDPYNVVDIAETIKKALSDKVCYEEKHNMLEQQLQSFSWEKNARETLDVYADMLI